MRAQNIRAEWWDTLIILDACRYDCFEEICLPQLTGIFEKRWSPASCTRGWLKAQCYPADFSDVVYISANPYASQAAFEAKNYRLQIPWMVIGAKERKEPMARKKEQKITGEFYDHDYWETSQKGGKGGYDSIASLDGLSREIAEQTTKVFDLKGKRLLDAGCGPGLVVARYRELGVEAYGIDWSVYALEGGAKIRPAVKEFCVLGSITDLSQWEDGFFDMVRCTQVLEHIYPEDIEQVVAEFARVLKPGGILLVDMPMCLPWEAEPRPDEREPSHVNIRRLEYWHILFSGVGLLIYQDAMIKFITEAPVWKGLKWQMAAYWKPIIEEKD
ncbi:MAG: class I SAM-dependent methyltransferase [Deltaproteobacteria bacterium]|nr:class I SAM-dependent methyltransferase [Deltaproteobacteria bacterium]